MIRAARALERGLKGILRPVLFAGMAALVAVITLQIVSRVFFNAVSWTEEVARFLMIWLTFAGAALALAEHRHIAVDVLVDRMPGGWRKAIRAVGLIASILFLVALSKIGWDFMNMQSFQKSASLRLPMIYVYAVIPIFGALMALVSIADLVILFGQDEETAE